MCRLLNDTFPYSLSLWHLSLPLKRAVNCSYDNPLVVELSALWRGITRGSGNTLVSQFALLNVSVSGLMFLISGDDSPVMLSPGAFRFWAFCLACYCTLING